MLSNEEDFKNLVIRLGGILIFIFIIVLSVDHLMSRSVDVDIHLQETLNQKNNIESQNSVEGVSSVQNNSIVEQVSKSGIIKEFYMDGIVKSEGVYVDGFLEGELKTFHENGQIESEMQFRHGIPEGTQVQ